MISSTRKLKTKAFFYEYIPKKGPEPGEQEEKVIFKTRAELYDPSMKDRDALNGKDVEQAITMIIRQPRSFIPSTKQFVELFDHRYEGIRWNIVEVRNDISENRFITILLAVITNE